jgi:hypothetical protein
VSISLADSDLDGEGSYAVSLTTSGGDSETVVLSEIVSAIGIFTGTIPTAPDGVIIEDGTLELSHGDIITATYLDSDDGSGNPATATDTAVADYVGPVISNVWVDVPGQEPTVSFETDELATARVVCGLVCGEPYTIEGSDLSLATSRTIGLTGVSAETDYFFVVEATDAAGNETVDTNSGQCYTFTTTGPEDIYVPSQYLTIQEAINRSWDGGTVWVADGTYGGEGNRDIDFKGRAITVRSENGPDNCIIDCGGTETEPHRGFVLRSGEGADSIVAGFTITNGFTIGGGGMYNGLSSSATVINCVFIANSASSRGGGMYNGLGSSPTVTNCTFRGNSAANAGGGMGNEEHSRPTVIGCTFSGNAAVSGGGMGNEERSRPTVIGCTFSGNAAVSGGGMSSWDFSSPSLFNCIFSGNVAVRGGGMNNGEHSRPGLFNCTIYGNWADKGGGGIYGDENRLTLTNCVLWANSPDQVFLNDATATITYSDVQGGWLGDGNIDKDPCFIEAGFKDFNGLWVEGDYHLLSPSLCIDAGDPNYIVEPNETDLGGRARVVGDAIDMGAYEADYVEAGMKISPQMLNCNNKSDYVKARFFLRGEFLPGDVDFNVPALAVPMRTASKSIRVLGSDKGSTGLEIIFDHEVFCDVLGDDGFLTDDGYLKVTVVGSLTNGQYFEGTDIIKVIGVR